jgi:hypothetical protein
MLDMGSPPCSWRKMGPNRLASFDLLQVLEEAGGNRVFEGAALFDASVDVVPKLRQLFTGKTVRNLSKGVS